MELKKEGISLNKHNAFLTILFKTFSETLAFNNTWCRSCIRAVCGTEATWL